jgi:hypothetical protein
MDYSRKSVAPSQACPLPLSPIFQNLLNQSLDRVLLIYILKTPSIPLPPQSPAHQNDQGVEELMKNSFNPSLHPNTVNEE